jgi:hypothetical protein
MCTDKYIITYPKYARQKYFHTVPRTTVESNNRMNGDLMMCGEQALQPRGE